VKAEIWKHSLVSDLPAAVNGGFSRRKIAGISRKVWLRVQARYSEVPYKLVREPAASEKSLASSGLEKFQMQTFSS